MNPRLLYPDYILPADLREGFGSEQIPFGAQKSDNISQEFLAGLRFIQRGNLKGATNPLISDLSKLDEKSYSKRDSSA